MSDKRFETVKDRNTPVDVSYMKSRYARLELWQERAAEIRELVLVTAGLLPMPERTPLNAVISGRIERDNYSVENVYFESFPGFCVTGNLYRPVGEGPFPGILNPHGHWKDGRLQNDDTCSVPGRCINFARQGYVAFSYDMVDYVDSHQWDHRRWNLRDRMWGISTAGLQLWNSIRALDFLQLLPDVDPERLACTGASGGGTQTFLLCAVDDRVKVAAPVNMISAHMHGGCVCENPPGLRIDTNNVEIGALMAPRPMIMVSATGDWTTDTPQVEFPAIRHIYELFGAADRIECVQIDAGHNYNRESREAVYSFFGKWLPAQPMLQPVVEQPFEVEDEKDLRLFPDVMPEGVLDIDGLVRQRIAESEAQFKAHTLALNSGEPEALARFEKVYRSILAHALAVPRSFDLDAEVLSQETDVDIGTKRVCLLENNRGARIPAVVVEPMDSIATKTVIVVDGPNGKPFMDNRGVRQLVERGWRVMGLDLPKQAGPERDPNSNLFDTYNRTDTQERVYEIVAAALWTSRSAERVALVGTGLGGAWCLLAAPFASVTDVAVDVDRSKLSDDGFLASELYVPNLRRAGDFRTAEILSLPRRLKIYDSHPEASQIVEWLCAEQVQE